jgi:hypothetical protein
VRGDANYKRNKVEHEKKDVVREGIVTKWKLDGGVSMCGFARLGLFLLIPVELELDSSDECCGELGSRYM